MLRREKKRDTFSRRHFLKPQLRQGEAKAEGGAVQPVWTKYFELEMAVKEEDNASGEEDIESGEDNVQLDGINEEVHGIASC